MTDYDHEWTSLRDLLRDSPLSHLLPDMESPSPPSPAAPFSAEHRTATSTKICAHCGAEIGTFPVAWKGRTDYWWKACPCREAFFAEEQRKTDLLVAAYDRSRAEDQVIAESVQRIAQWTLDTFEPSLLTSEQPEQHPYTFATAWLTRIRDLPHGDYRDEHAPPAALYFYSPGKGRGKTHLAAAIANAATAAGKRVAWVEEGRYLAQRWGQSIAAAEQYTTIIGEKTWLTVIDDIGQRGRAGETVADAWYALVNRRWPQARWTIITTNKTPEELLQQGTINTATYSRLMQLTAKQLLVFHGTDQRLS